ncbi:MAG: FKBP-type peptidyl-prolyl cis-trans isomerase, partial [Myxococcota bacterium]|nr:FKBP-type peptidyl-prolyl cis-trans isomerase [Myxococcota bacterium]
MPETIRDGVVVAFDYVIRDEGGALLDQSTDEEPGVYLHGAANIAPGLERALMGRRVGESVTVEVPPDQGFGARDSRPTVVVPRTLFEPGLDITLGMQCIPEAPDGDPTPLWVVGVTDDEVTLDPNHPLA